MDFLTKDINQLPIEVRGERRRVRKRRRKKKRFRSFIFNFILISFIVSTSTLGYAVWRVDKALDHISLKPGYQTEGRSFSYESKQAMEKPKETKTFSVLIMGRDSRPETRTNLTDVMILAAIDPVKKEVSMVSIPRDTKVMVPEVSRELKVNSVFNMGDQLRREEERLGKIPDTDGPTLAKQTVERLFKIPIDHYIVVDFNSFVEIVDEVGGITVQVERDLIYNDPTDHTHINLRAGLQQLDGENALDWIRHRHDDRGVDYYSSDFDRNRRQQEAIKAIVQKLGGWSSATKILDLMDTMAEHIQTDMEKDQIKNLMWSLNSFDLNHLKSIETPHVYWDSHRLQTVIPEEDLSLVHNELNFILNKGKNK